MIKELEIENFKCFKKLKIEFGKLTLLTGANSSGKSSIIYGLLAPLQSVGFPAIFSPNGKYVNMGDFEDISNMHSKTNVIKINLMYSLKIGPKEELVDTFLETSWVNDSKKRLPTLHKLIAKSSYFNLAIDCSKKLKQVEFEYFEVKDPMGNVNSIDFQRKMNNWLSEIISYGKNETNDTKKERKKTVLESRMDLLELQFKRNIGKLTFTFRNVEEDLKKSIETKGSFGLSTVYSSIKSAFKEFELKTNYISSFRYHPERLRVEISKSDLTVGKYGENCEDQIISWENKRGKEFQEFKKIIKKINLLQDIKAFRLTGGNYQLKIKPFRKGVFSSITDVGFGISQFLPIVVADIQLGKNSSLIISQPEIHLHPSIQSDFGDYLCEQISNNNKSYIVETHSEYLLNKIRLLIVENKIAADDVKAYYLEKKDSEHTISPLKFTNKGEILDAPESFFNTYMLDVMNIALKSE